MTTDARAAGLIAFYAARLDEDEVTAQDLARSYPGPWSADSSWVRDAGGGTVVHDEYHWSALPHIARRDPARALREVAAGRAVIKRYELAAAAAARGSVSSFVHGQDDGYAEACLDAIRDSVAAWDGHPDYDPAWRMDP